MTIEKKPDPNQQQNQQQSCIDPDAPPPARTVLVTDEQLLAVYLSGRVSALASSLAVSMPTSVAVRVAVELTNAHRRHLSTDPLCRTSLLDGLHAMLAGNDAPNPTGGCGWVEAP